MPSYWMSVRNAWQETYKCFTSSLVYVFPWQVSPSDKENSFVS